jgi:hypothetical protein
VTIALLALAALAQSDPDRVRAFLDGKPGAEADLRRRSTAALHATASARLRDRGSSSYGKLLALHWETKRLHWDSEAARAAAHALDTSELDGEHADLKAVLAFVSDRAGVNVVVDPASEPAKGEAMRPADRSLLNVLDAATVPRGLDYDWRYGVLWIAEPRRLWTAAPETPEPTLAPDRQKAARAWIADLASDAPESRDRAAAELRRLGAGVVSLLEEAGKNPDAEVTSRCRALADELRPRPRAWALPETNAWAKQALAGDDKSVADKLRSTLLSASYRDTTLRSVLELFDQTGDVKFEVDPGAPFPATLSIVARRLPLAHALELATLPYGLDAKIERGRVVIVDRPK